jgi:hypothetical protein
MSLLACLRSRVRWIFFMLKTCQVKLGADFPEFFDVQVHILVSTLPMCSSRSLITSKFWICWWPLQLTMPAMTQLSR